MPIRKRLSDPYGDDIAKFDRRMKYGAPPKAPPKPSAAEREPFVRGLKGVPVGEVFGRREYFRLHADRYIVEKWEIWGQTLCVLPLHKFLDAETIECTGAAVARHNPDRRGVCPRLRLRGEQKTWYSQVLNWISETVYDA